MTRRPILLDLYCGAGGAGRGYYDAGFEVVGVDITPQPSYPFEVIQADAIKTLVGMIAGAPLRGRFIGDFAAVHASPPCQHDTSMQSVAQNAAAHPDLIGPTRRALEAAGLPYVIENVGGAREKLREPFMLCGSMFGLGVRVSGELRELRRHRLFETNWDVGLVPSCGHQHRTIGFYGHHAHLGRRSSDGELSGWQAVRAASLAMEINWMKRWVELKEAIPPDYTRWIGERLLARVRVPA